MLIYAVKCECVYLIGHSARAAKPICTKYFPRGLTVSGSKILNAHLDVT